MINLFHLGLLPLLSSTSSDTFLKRAISLEEINALNDGKLRELNRAINAVATAKARLDQEVTSQQQNLAAMQKQKEAAEKALALVGGKSLTGGFVVAKSPVAAPAPPQRLLARIVQRQRPDD